MNMLSKMPVVGGDVTNVQGMTQVVDDLVQQTLPSLTDVVTTACERADQR